MIRVRRIKLVWGTADEIRGRWYLGLWGIYRRDDAKDEDGLAISLRGLLRWSPVLAVPAWALAATVAFLILRQEPRSTLTYADVVLAPLRRELITEKRELAALARSLDLAERREWQDAMPGLQRGLARVPGDRRVRLALADCYRQAGQRVQARETLVGGLTGEYPGRQYLEALMRFAEEGEEHDDIVAWCERSLVQVQAPGLAADRVWLEERRFAALLAAKRAPEALASVESVGAGATREERRVLALLALERKAEALAALGEWARQPGADALKLARTGARVYRETGRWEEMEQALATLREQAAGDPEAWFFALEEQVAASRLPTAEATLREMIRRFGQTPGFMERLAAKLDGFGRARLLERAVVAARDEGISWEVFQRPLISAYLLAGQWEPANNVLAGLARRSDAESGEDVWLGRTIRLIDAVRRPDEPIQSALVDFIRQHPFAVRDVARISTALIESGRLATARRIVDVAMLAFPGNPRLQEVAAEVNLQILAHTPAVHVAADETWTRRVSESDFNQHVERLLAEQKWAEAARYVSQVLLAPPAWLERRDERARVAQLRIAQAQQNRQGVRMAARLLLTGELRLADEAVRIGREWLAAGDADSAEVLMREVLHRHEAHAPARRALAELTAAGADRK